MPTHFLLRIPQKRNVNEFIYVSEIISKICIEIGNYSGMTQFQPEYPVYAIYFAVALSYFSFYIHEKQMLATTLKVPVHS